jgi:hypothetical protein
MSITFRVRIPVINRLSFTCPNSEILQFCDQVHDLICNLGFCYDSYFTKSIDGIKEKYEGERKEWTTIYQLCHDKDLAALQNHLPLCCFVLDPTVIDSLNSIRCQLQA